MQSQPSSVRPAWIDFENLLRSRLWKKLDGMAEEVIRATEKDLFVEGIDDAEKLKILNRLEAQRDFWKGIKARLLNAARRRPNGRT